MTLMKSIERSHERLADACAHLGETVLAEHNADPVWVARVQKAARSLERALGQHRDLAEAEDGPLTQMAAEKPALVEEVETQIAEHGTLLGRAETLAKECERAIEFEDPNFEILQLDGHILYLMTRRHMTWESVLIYETFFREEGGEEGA